MKKKWLSILLCLCMALSLLPATAITAGAVGEEPITELWVGDTAVVTAEEGTETSTSGTGWSYSAGTLTLTGADIESGSHNGAAIYADGDLTIALVGDNTVHGPDLDSGSSCGVYGGSKIIFSGTGTLTAIGGMATNGSSCGVYSDNSGITVAENATVTANGGAATSGSSGSSYGMYSWNGITVGVGATVTANGGAATSGSSYGMYSWEGTAVGENATVTATGGDSNSSDSYGMYFDSVTIDEGATVTATGDAATSGSSYGMYSHTDETIEAVITVNANATVTATGGTASGYSIGVDSENGGISISGRVTANGGDSDDDSYGMYGYDDITVNEGAVVVANGGEGGDSSYGVCAGNIIVNDGSVTAMGGTAAGVYGNSYGIYSDGYITVSGGSVDATGGTATNDDSYGMYGENTITVSGGSVTATGGMAGDGDSYGIYGNGDDAITVSGGSVTTTGGEATGSSYDVFGWGNITVSNTDGLTVNGDMRVYEGYSLTVSSDSVLTTKGTTWADTVVNNGTLVNDGTLVLPETTTAEQIQAMNVTGNGIIKAGDKIYLGGSVYTNVGDVSTSGLDLYTTTPTAATYYTAGSGYILFTPAVPEGTSATVTLHNAEINAQEDADGVADSILLPAGTVTMQVSGENKLSANADYAGGICSEKGNPTNLTITSSDYGTLEISAIGTANAGALGRPDGDLDSLTIGGNVSVTATASGNEDGAYGTTLDGQLTVETAAKFTTKGDSADLMAYTIPYDIQNFEGLAVFSYETNLRESDVYGVCDWPGVLAGLPIGSINSEGTIYEISLKITSGSTLTIPAGNILTVNDFSNLTNNGTIVNNGTIALPSGTDAATIQALKLTGSGVVQVDSNYYTNDGAGLKTIGNSSGLTLTSAGDNTKSVADDGYSWDGSTLTLGNVYIDGTLTLPYNQSVIINTTADSFMSDGICAASDAGGYYYHIDLTFTGSEPLTINGGINNGVNNDTVTVQDGAQVMVNGCISIGASGTDGTLNVIDSGTALNITSPYGYAVLCDTVNVGNGAALTVHTQGEGSMGVEALSGGVNITGGSTLTTGCDYGVYIIGGTLNVDSTSTLITNGAVAPFCVVDTTSPANDQSVSLPGIPSGTEIASVLGTNVSYGSAYTYWSLVPTNGSLSVADENSTPVTLTGAVTGTLTFVKAASNPIGGGGGESVSYTLAFETNGGSTIDTLSKTSGSTVALTSYIPTRDGYDFAGWYSDAALTDAVTSVTLTKNTAVYAKWTEKIANPFGDVSDSDYYHDAVLWAVEKGITNGTSDTTFSPNLTCTRAQMVTLLWRAQGSPEPTSANCPFTDVAQNAYYYKAVLWAVEEGITVGTSATTFGSNDIVMRDQAVTFLWRVAGQPEAASANPFADVSTDAYYYNAVLWAVEKGITQGTSASSFSLFSPCTRAQIVTFLCRYAGE